VHRLYNGRCHCGAVRFDAMVDIAAGTWKCNCSICAMTRLWSVEAAPGNLRVLEGVEDMVDYRFNSRVVHHYFCRHCGVRPFQHVELTDGRPPYYNVNIACLEGVDVNELMAAPISYPDGLHDRWEAIPAEIRHL
jgi:hypothetical protein